MTAIVFNSVPMEDINATWGSNPSLTDQKLSSDNLRVKTKKHFIQVMKTHLDL